MTKNKTAETEVDVNEFIDSVQNEIKRSDSHKLVKMFSEITGAEPKMWGPTIIGLGKYRYKYSTGREGEAPLAGFSPRKDNLVIYTSIDFENRESLLAQLGKHKLSKSCVYIKKLDDIDPLVLMAIVRNSMQRELALYPS